MLNVKDSRALKTLKELVEAGVLKKEGKLKGSYYNIEVIYHKFVVPYLTHS